MYIAFIKNRRGKYYKYMDSGMRLVNFEAQFFQLTNTGACSHKQVMQ